MCGNSPNPSFFSSYDDSGEFNTGGFPKGLSIMLGMMAQWIYDKPPLLGIRFEEPLRELKAELAVRGACSARYSDARVNIM